MKTTTQTPTGKRKLTITGTALVGAALAPRAPTASGIDLCEGARYGSGNWPTSRGTIEEQ